MGGADVVFGSRFWEVFSSRGLFLAHGRNYVLALLSNIFTNITGITRLAVRDQVIAFIIPQKNISKLWVSIISAKAQN